MIQETLLKSEEQAVFALRSLYRGYGYLPFRMSKFEEYELYIRNKDFLVSDRIITFNDTNGRLMALKPDVTLSIVKNSREPEGSVRKVYYNENVYRPARGSRCFKEIMQVGLECIGQVDAYCISETLALAEKSLSEISPEYVLDISSLDMLSYVLERMDCAEDVRKRILSCIGEKNRHDLVKVCADAGIPESASAPLLALLSCGETCEDVRNTLWDLYDDPVWHGMIDALTQAVSVLPADSIRAEHVRIDFSVIHDMYYYNGIVFCGFVRGIPNSVLSGGQYDRLMSRMGKSERAVGFAVYLDQLELLEKKAAEYDADVLLLYDTDTPLPLLHETVSALTAEGKCVLAERKIPEKMRFREIRDLRGEGGRNA